MADGEMETRLKRLLASNEEAERIARGRELKRQGQRIVGSVCGFMAEELVWAAGLVPWRISGTWRAAVPKGEVYRPSNTCTFCTHVLDSLLEGELDFLAGAVISFKDDDMRRLHGAWEHAQRTPFLRYLHVPHQDTPRCIQFFVERLEELKGAIEEQFQVQVTDRALADAIQLYNQSRSLFRELYELRQREVPPLSGAEFLSLTTAAFCVPRDELNRELSALLPYLQQRKAPVGTTRPRIMVASEMLDHPGYVQMIEDTGCLVVMDDMDTGTGYCWGQVDSSLPPLEALARHYMLTTPNPRSYYWEKQVDQVIGWARDWRVDGVLHLPQLYCQPRLFGAPYYEDRLKAAGIPVITLVRDYHLANLGQLRTRVGAFLEMLRVRV